MATDKQVKAFVWVSTAEGISYLLLLLVAMPLKYIGDMPEYVRISGAIHGLLFVVYAYLLLQLWLDKRVNLKQATILFLLSLVPLGYRWANHRVLAGA